MYPSIQQQQQQPFGNQNQNAIKPPQMMHHPSQMPNPLQSNMNMNPTNMLNQTMNMNSNNLAAHHQQHGMPPLQSGPPPMYDHMLPNPMNGLQKPSEFIYLNQQHAPPPHHLNQLAAQNQYMPSRNNVIITILIFCYIINKYVNFF